MAEHENPWARAKSGTPAACHYRCGFMAPLTEPGKPWKAHKVCADKAATGEDQTSRVTPWTGDDSGGHVADRPLGCGPYPESVTSGRFCAGAGTQLSCQLCPQSPTYWDREETTK